MGNNNNDDDSEEDNDDGGDLKKNKKKKKKQTDEEIYEEKFMNEMSNYVRKDIPSLNEIQWQSAEVDGLLKRDDNADVAGFYGLEVFQPPSKMEKVEEKEKEKEEVEGEGEGEGEEKMN